MRQAFTRTLVELAGADPQILLLTGDLGYTVLEPFAERFPDRFWNVGVAEENMIGVATGLAEAGFLPFVYSIATFASLRPYEFIRNGPIRHQLPVRVVGVGGGFEYGPAGPTHYGLEDIAVMRAQPGITVIAPADHEQARSALLATRDLRSPIYYRLGKDDRFTLPGLNGRFALGHAQLARDGTDALFVTMGSVARDTAAAADALAGRGISCAMLVVASVTPAPIEDLAEQLSRFALAMTVEAHCVTGGVGSLVAEVIAERGIGCRLVRCGVSAAPAGACGSEAYMHRLHGLSPDGLVKTAVGALRATAAPRATSL